MVPFYEQKKELLQVGLGNKIDFPLHLHISLELFYVIKGEIKAKIGGNQYTVRTGELALIFPNTTHDYLTVSKQEDTEYIMIIASPLLTDDFKNSLLSSHPINPIVSSENLHKDAIYAIKSLLDESCESERLKKLFVQLILTRVFSQITLESNKNLLPQDITAQIISYISEHFTENISLDFLSKKFGISRYQISRIFSNTIEVKYNDYLNTLRIWFAKTLLENTNQDILGIGFDCGFENQQTFNRVFKSHCGVSPKQYRKNSKNNFY